MSNDNNNLTLADGTPNLANPRVLAAFVDGVGILLSGFVNKVGPNPDAEMDAEDRVNLLTVYRTLQEMRNAVGIGEDWYNEAQHELIQSVISEGQTKRKNTLDAIVQGMLAAGVPLDLIPPEYRPKPDAATTADALLDQLRADGVIG